ncbi:hypothetical protein FACS189446_0630 [Bacteroidia bacterium]|nr:hypothetical protein FACS189446_0630 [Bacteroidia bacterium]
MDKLSEYIPLLIIIVSVVISLVRKSKQPVKESALPKEVFPQIPAFEEPVYEKPAPEKRVGAPVAPKPKMMTPEKKQFVAKKEPVSYKKTAEMPEIEAYESAAINLSDPEELKKAVIYSEIFNRKDF